MQLYFYLGAIICCSGGEKTIEWKREQGLTYDADTSVALRDSWTVVSCYNGSVKVFSKKQALEVAKFYRLQVKHWHQPLKYSC